jgi:Mn-dependent DtxR family transcriptional regulator
VTPVARNIVDQVCAFLDHPRACPHGRPIPPGEECCLAAAAAVGPAAAEEGEW